MALGREVTFGYAASLKFSLPRSAPQDISPDTSDERGSGMHRLKTQLRHVRLLGCCRRCLLLLRPVLAPNGPESERGPREVYLNPQAPVAYSNTITSMHLHGRSAFLLLTSVDGTVHVVKEGCEVTERASTE